MEMFFFFFCSRAIHLYFKKKGGKKRKENRRIRERKLKTCTGSLDWRLVKKEQSNDTLVDDDRFYTALFSALEQTHCFSECDST